MLGADVKISYCARPLSFGTSGSINGGSEMDAKKVVDSGV